MDHLAYWGGILLVLVTLWEVFETMILPRAIVRPGRVTHVFYRSTNWLKSSLAHRIPSRGLRETVLAAYGPLSLLTLVALWAFLLIVGFGLIHYGRHTHFTQYHGQVELGTDVYFSGSTFFTLGYGDFTPAGHIGRTLAVMEAGIGFGMLASVIGYFPILYQAFSTREATIVRFANRCGGEIDGVGLIARYAHNGNFDALTPVLETLEEWIADLLETTATYPVLATYRSQRDDRSWIGALTAVLDATVILQLKAETPWPPRLVDQAELTYSMAHRAVQAMAKVLRQKPDPNARRFRDLDALRRRLARSGVEISADNDERWEELAGRYDPEVLCLAQFLVLHLPAWPTTD